MKARSRVRSFWYGDELSPYEVMCIRSFLAHGHDFDLYSYSPDLEPPPGCNLLDASEILPRSRLMFYDAREVKSRVALFANAFRYKLLAEKGGWWVDLDVVCLTDSLPGERYVFGYQDGRKMINNAVLKMPPGDEVTRLCLERSLELGTDATWGQTGPRLLTEVVNSLQLQGYARPLSDFYPYHWDDATNALDPAHTERLLGACKTSTFVHLWNEILARSGVDKSQPPSPDSLLGHFFRLYY
jgi:hypothetical protein